MAWVVVGDDSEVGVVGGDFAHLTSFALVTVTAAPEDNAESALTFLAERFEGSFEGIRRMGIVDNDAPAFGVSLDGLHASGGGFDVGEGKESMLHRDARCKSKASGNECIFGLERPGHSEGDGY